MTFEIASNSWGLFWCIFIRKQLSLSIICVVATCFLIFSARPTATSLVSTQRSSVGQAAGEILRQKLIALDREKVEREENYPLNSTTLNLPSQFGDIIAANEKCFLTEILNSTCSLSSNGKEDFLHSAQSSSRVEGMSTLLFCAILHNMGANPPLNENVFYPLFANCVHDVRSCLYTWIFFTKL